jgi:NAD(P)-dependent dehydrogenase (short-subunit alcohol dehydrogenase family)
VAWSEADIPDQSGRVAVVTGANGGLGYETARALAIRGARVIMAARDQGRAARARERILATGDALAPQIVPLDLARLDSVAAAAATIMTEHDRLDLLINNAGIMACPEGRTADGFERQLGINHLGHFALTRHLLPLLLRTPGARVVTVTSMSRHTGRSLNPDRPLDAGRYDPWLAYGRAKLANLHFAVGLHERLRAAGADTASLAAHPGLSNTGLQATSVETSGGGLSQRFFHMLARRTGMPPERGALSQLRAATDPGARSGELYAPRFVSVGPTVRRPLVGRSVSRRSTAALWQVSERETGLTFDVATMMPDGRR